MVSNTAATAATLLWLSVSTVVSAEPLGQVVPAQPNNDDSVAIVPFSNITGATDDDWIGTGIAETLSIDLARVNGLSVVDATDVEAGRLLGTRWIVSGGYQRLGERLRITARVVDVETDTIIHTERIDGVVTELFALQDQLAVGVRRELIRTRGSMKVPTLAVGRPSTPNETVAAGVIDPTPARDSAPEVSPRGGIAVVPAGLIDGPPPPAPPEIITRDAAGRATVRAVRLTGPWQLDGVLSEEIYQQVPALSDFIQQLPDEGAAATERTEVWVFFDDAHVYTSARLWDTAPASEWTANDMRRDSFQLINNDNLSVAFDTFYDRRNGVVFMVNPIAGIFDFQLTDEGNPNTDWNPVWDVRTGRFDGGWTVEMQIPFKSIRYQPGTEQIWGFQVGRRVIRKNESSYLTPVSISAGAGIFRLSAAATLVGLEVPSGGTNLEIKPYATASSATDVNADPAIFNQGDGDFGLDVKYGVTQNLTADFTYNTDFAQVEVDQQQVNLTRFSLFFPEKREFFLEGRGIFDFGRAAGMTGGGPGGGGPRRVGGGGFGGGGTAPTVFFSRRIGLNEGLTVPILGGGRLTGKAGKFKYRCTEHPDRRFAGSQRIVNQLHRPATQA
jgi:TolB-like protein